MLKWLFKSKREMQGLIDSTRKSLANAESQLVERNKFIKDLVEENGEMKETIKEMRKITKKIKELSEGNKYNKPEIILNKINELLRP